MCGFFCIGFIDFMLKSRSLLEYTNLFSSNECEKNEKIIITDKKKYDKNDKKSFVLFVINVENLKTLKYHIFLKDIRFLLFVVGWS